MRWKGEWQIEGGVLPVERLAGSPVLSGRTSSSFLWGMVGNSVSNFSLRSTLQTCTQFTHPGMCNICVSVRACILYCVSGLFGCEIIMTTIVNLSWIELLYHTVLVCGGVYF